jgi:hypothetical protein
MSELRHDGGHYAGDIQIRTIGQVTSGEMNRSKVAWAVQVDHIFFAGTCEHGHMDPGSIGLAVAEEGHGDPVSAIMDPATALLLADRLTRCAQIVLGQDEEPANADHELLVAYHRDD